MNVPVVIQNISEQLFTITDNTYIFRPGFLRSVLAPKLFHPVVMRSVTVSLN